MTVCSIVIRTSSIIQDCEVSYRKLLHSCPCLKCTIKIIQSGVKTVIYNLTYKVLVFTLTLFKKLPADPSRDDASARLFEEAGVELRRFDPNRRFNLRPEDGRFTP
jgi:dCMP deaminase